MMEERQLKHWEYEEDEGLRPVGKLLRECQRTGSVGGGDGNGKWENWQEDYKIS